MISEKSKIIVNWNEEKRIQDLLHYEGDLCIDLHIPKFDEKFLSVYIDKNKSIVKQLMNAEIAETFVDTILTQCSDIFRTNNKNYNPVNKCELECAIMLNFFNAFYLGVTNFKNRYALSQFTPHDGVFTFINGKQLYRLLTDNIEIASESVFSELVKTVDFDLFITLNPLDNYWVQSSTKFLLEPGYSVLWQNKSGISTKFNLLMKADTIDNGYTDYVSFSFVNVCNSKSAIYSGMNITQGNIVENQVHKHDNTVRGINGFGSGYIKQN